MEKAGHLSTAKAQQAQVIQESTLRPTHARNESKDLLLDTEISDVMFHFDAIVSELERSTLEKSPAPVSPIPPVANSVSPKHESPRQNGKISQLDNAISLNMGKSVQEKASDSQEVSLSEKPPEKKPQHEAVSTRASIQERRQQFLHPVQANAQDRSHSPARDSEALSRAGKVKSLIAQMQSERSSSSSPPSSPPPTKHRRQRSHSPSISKSISRFVHGTDNQENHENQKHYTPPPVRKRIQSPFFVQESFKKQEKDTSQLRESSTFEKSVVPEPTKAKESVSPPLSPREKTKEGRAATVVEEKATPQGTHKQQLSPVHPEKKEMDTSTVTHKPDEQSISPHSRTEEPPVEATKFIQSNGWMSKPHVTIQEPMTKTEVERPFTSHLVTQEPGRESENEKPSGQMDERPVPTQGSVENGNVQPSIADTVSKPKTLIPEGTSPKRKEFAEDSLSPLDSCEGLYRMRSSSDITQSRRPHVAYFSKSGRIARRQAHHTLLEGKSDGSKVATGTVSLVALKQYSV